jgi:hypothetical protein
MQNLNRLQTAKFLINSFYEETPLDANFTDTIEIANDKIIKDFQVAKNIAFKCADLLAKEHTHNHPISWNVKRKQFYDEVKSIIEKLTIEQTFKND